MSWLCLFQAQGTIFIGTRLKLSLADPLIELARLRLRVQIELLAQEFLQRAILLDGGGLLVCNHVQLHEPAMGLFMERIQRH